MVLKYTIKEKDEFNNVRDVLKSHFKVSTRLLMKLKRLEMIFLNDSHCSVNDLVNFGDNVSFSLDYEEDNSNIVPSPMDLDLIYEDDAIIVINKPPFMTVHPTTYHFNDTLSNGLRYYFDEIGLKKKIRPINRLDRNTSGLIVFAKNEYVQESLIKQMADGTFKKKYLGIIQGILNKKNGTIRAPISRKENSIVERKIDKDGFPSITHYSVISEHREYSLVEFVLETGRTHQIRVHTQYIGHPLLGDSLYGAASFLIGRQALHSYYISFIHPISSRMMEFNSALPKDIKSLL